MERRCVKSYNIFQRYPKLCQKCNPKPKGEFEKVIDLHESGITVYVYNKENEYDENTTIKVTPEFVVCCRKSKELDNSDIAVELSQYKSNCNKCENILRDVRGMIGELKKVNENEVLGVCHHCKTLCKTSSCERCRFLRRKFLKNEPSSFEQQRENYKEWLSEVKGLLKIVLHDKTQSNRRHEHERNISELTDITKRRQSVSAESIKKYARREHGTKTEVDKTEECEKHDEYVTQSDSVRYKKGDEFKPLSSIGRQREYHKHSDIDEYGKRQEFDTQNDSGDVDRYGKRGEYGIRVNIDYNKRKEYGAGSDFERDEKLGGYDTRGDIYKYDKQRNYDKRKYIDRYDKRGEYERRNDIDKYDKRGNTGYYDIRKGVDDEKKQEYDSLSDIDTYIRKYGKRGEYTQPKSDTELHNKRSLYDKRGGFEERFRRYEEKPQQSEYDELRDTQSLENLKRLLRVLKTPFDETMSNKELDSLILEIRSPKRGHKTAKETALRDSVEDLIKLVKSFKKAPFNLRKKYGKTESEHERDEINILLHIINKMVETKQSQQRKAAGPPTDQVHESPPEIKKLLQNFERSASKREYDIDFFPPKPIAITSKENIFTRIKESKKLKPKISVIIKDQLSNESISGFSGLKSALKKPYKKPPLKEKVGIAVPSGFTLHTLPTPSKKKTKPKKQTTFAGNEIIKPRKITTKEETSIKIAEQQGDQTSETIKTKSAGTSMVSSSSTPSQVEMKAKKTKVLEDEEEHSPPRSDLIALLKQKSLKKHVRTEKKGLGKEKDTKSESETEKTLQSGLDKDEATPSKESKTGILKLSKSHEDTNLKTEPKPTKKTLLTQSMLDYRESPKVETHEIKKHVIDMPHETKSTIDIRSLIAFEEEKKSSASLLRLKPLFTVESYNDESRVEQKKKRSKNKGNRIELDDDESSSFEEEKENKPDTHKQSKAYAKMFSKLLKERDTEKKAIEKLKKQKSKITKIPHIASLPALRKKAIHTYENIVGGVVVCDEQGEPSVPVHMIKGTEIVRFDPHYKEKMLIRVKEPLLFRSHPECPLVAVAAEEPTVEETIHKIGKSKSTFDRLLNHDTKGVFRYELSNRDFIDKGLTKLPTVKVLRRMNIYKMTLANPLSHWFKRHRRERLFFYDTGEKLAEIDDDGHGRWYYKNGMLALDYYKAEEPHIGSRYVIYSSGEKDKHGRFWPVTVLACFDHLGNGIVYDHGGNVRLKYNQSEGMVVDEKIGPVGRWKWHNLNDPPVLMPKYVDTHLVNKAEQLDDEPTADEEDKPDIDMMLSIELDNFIKEKANKLLLKYKPFRIKPKFIKINDQFSLRVIDQANITLHFNDVQNYIKLNLGMSLISDNILGTEGVEVTQVMTPFDRVIPKSESVENLKKLLAAARKKYKSYGLATKS